MRALRAGVDLGPPSSVVAENGTRCRANEPACVGGAADLAHAIFEEWHASDVHCQTLQLFPDSDAVQYAVGVFVQREDLAGGALAAPHYNAVFEILDRNERDR